MKTENCSLIFRVLDSQCVESWFIGMIWKALHSVSFKPFSAKAFVPSLLRFQKLYGGNSSDN